MAHPEFRTDRGRERAGPTTRQGDTFSPPEGLTDGPADHPGLDRGHQALTDLLVGGPGVLAFGIAYGILAGGGATRAEPFASQLRARESGFPEGPAISGPD